MAGQRTARGSAASFASPATLADSRLARYRELVDDWDAFTAALCRPLPVAIWANPSRIQVAELMDLLAGQGLDPRPVPGLPDAILLDPALRVGQHWWYWAGLAHAQELVSQLPARLLDLAPGQRVLDMCAAPGGKTAQLAFALGNRGTLIANDIAMSRLKALQANLDRLGVLNVTTTCRDAGSWPTASGQFDRLLVDAPCSSEGTLRRNPSLLQRFDPAAPARLWTRQRALLRKAVQRCRPGGRILYSTCTFAPEENELVVADILAEFPGALRLLPQTLPGFVTAPGVTSWGERELPPELAHCLRLWPHHNDTGGFFIAVLEKDAGLPAEAEPEPARFEEDDVRPWLDGLDAKYGLPPDYWDGYRVNRQTRRGLHLMAPDHAPPAQPPAESRGLFFHRTNVRPPKPTTAGAMLFGQAVTRFRLELTDDQLAAYLGRTPFAPTPEQRTAIGVGQVVVGYRGRMLGVAVLHRSGVVESYFPRTWSLAAGAAETPGGAGSEPIGLD